MSLLRRWMLVARPLSPRGLFLIAALAAAIMPFTIAYAFAYLGGYWPNQTGGVLKLRLGQDPGVRDKEKQAYTDGTIDWNSAGAEVSFSPLAAATPTKCCSLRRGTLVWGGTVSLIQAITACPAPGRMPMST
jgi:hypothetical protein